MFLFNKTLIHIDHSECKNCNTVRWNLNKNKELNTKYENKKQSPNCQTVLNWWHIKKDCLRRTKYWLCSSYKRRSDNHCPQHWSSLNGQAILHQYLLFVWQSRFDRYKGALWRKKINLFDSLIWHPTSGLMKHYPLSQTTSELFATINPPFTSVRWNEALDDVTEDFPTTLSW